MNGSKIEIVSVSLKKTKMHGAILAKVGILHLSDLLNEFGDLIGFIVLQYVYHEIPPCDVLRNFLNTYR